jgi:Skp family chaperone for outer membrane proteins
MNSTGVLIGGLGLLSLGLAIALVALTQRFRRAARAAEAQHREALGQLRDRSQRTTTQLETQLQQTRESLQTSQREKADLETQVEALKQQCVRLRDDLKQQAQQVQQDTQAIAFEQLQTLLTQHPTVRCMAEAKPDLPARNLVSLFTSLDNLARVWGYEAIGQPWQSTSYDPQLHEGDVGDLSLGETVYVRFVGYREVGSQRIRVPAKVSRTLPMGVGGKV